MKLFSQPAFFPNAACGTCPLSLDCLVSLPFRQTRNKPKQLNFVITTWQTAFIRMCEYVCMCLAKWITSLVSASGLALIPEHITVQYNSIHCTDILCCIALCYITLSSNTFHWYPVLYCIAFRRYLCCISSSGCFNMHHAMQLQCNILSSYIALPWCKAL